MSEREIIKKYRNNNLSIVWKPKKCIHAAECVKLLPKVYDPKGKPWIKAENATIDELKNQINACPSGALSYELDGEETKNTNRSEIKIEVLENGPLLVYGTLDVTKPNGEKETKSKTTAFCRCGSSANKPYCDGAHINEEFKG
jgi:uncharacterized Fe-S cluster protein YjdI